MSNFKGYFIVVFVVLYATCLVSVHGFAPSIRSTSIKPRPFHTSSPSSKNVVYKFKPLYQANQHNQDESSSSLSTRIPSKASRGWSDFMYGARHAHENFLSIFAKVVVTIFKFVLPITLLFALGTVYSPSLEEMVRTILVRLLMAIAILSKLLQYILAFPIFGLIIAPKIKRNGLKVALRRRPILRGHRLLISGVLLAPIIEEIVYRFLFHRFWWKRLVERFTQKTKETDDSSDPNASQRRWFGYAPWVTTSSILFATAHMLKYLPPPEKAIVDEFLPGLMRFQMKFGPISSALVSTISAGHLSFHVFSPMYQQRGVMASIGAHFMWNFNTLTLFWQAMIRLPIPFARRRKSKREDHEESS